MLFFLKFQRRYFSNSLKFAFTPPRHTILCYFIVYGLSHRCSNEKIFQKLWKERNYEVERLLTTLCAVGRVPRDKKNKCLSFHVNYTKISVIDFCHNVYFYIKVVSYGKHCAPCNIWKTLFTVQYMPECGFSLTYISPCTGKPVFWHCSACPIMKSPWKI